tara:strand:- start:103 stop:438 length:336 start_codon:yes stop_codon:yes gene_type:complete
MGDGAALPRGITTVSPNMVKSLENSLMALRIFRNEYLITLQHGVYRITSIFKLDPSASGNTSLLNGEVGIEIAGDAVVNSGMVKSDTYKRHIESTIDIIQDIPDRLCINFL